MTLLVPDALLPPVTADLHAGCAHHDLTTRRNFRHCHELDNELRARRSFTVGDFLLHSTHRLSPSGGGSVCRTPPPASERSAPGRRRCSTMLGDRRGVRSRCWIPPGSTPRHSLRSKRASFHPSNVGSSSRMRPCRVRSAADLQRIDQGLSEFEQLAAIFEDGNELTGMAADALIASCPCVALRILPGATHTSLVLPQPRIRGRQSRLTRRRRSI